MPANPARPLWRWKGTSTAACACLRRLPCCPRCTSDCRPSSVKGGNSANERDAQRLFQSPPSTMPPSLSPASVVRLKAKEAQVVRGVCVEKLCQRNHVAQALGHFLVPQEEVARVHKVIGPLAAAVKALCSGGEARGRKLGRRKEAYWDGLRSCALPHRTVPARWCGGETQGRCCNGKGRVSRKAQLGDRAPPPPSQRSQRRAPARVQVHFAAEDARAHG